MPPVPEANARAWYREVESDRISIESPSSEAPVAKVSVLPVATTVAPSITMLPTNVAAEPATVIVTLLAPGAVRWKK